MCPRGEGHHGTQDASNGDVVPESGIYRVTHAAHRLPHEVTLLKGQAFPRCSHCAVKVIFEPIRLAPQLKSGIVIYQLTPVDDPAA